MRSIRSVRSMLATLDSSTRANRLNSIGVPTSQPSHTSARKSQDLWARRVLTPLVVLDASVDETRGDPAPLGQHLVGELLFGRIASKVFVGHRSPRILVFATPARDRDGRRLVGPPRTVDCNLVRRQVVASEAQEQINGTGVYLHEGNASRQVAARLVGRRSFSGRSMMSHSSPGLGFLSLTPKNVAVAAVSSAISVNVATVPSARSLSTCQWD